MQGDTSIGGSDPCSAQLLCLSPGYLMWQVPSGGPDTKHLLPMTNLKSDSLVSLPFPGSLFPSSTWIRRDALPLQRRKEITSGSHSHHRLICLPHPARSFLVICSVVILGGGQLCPPGPPPQGIWQYLQTFLAIMSRT